MKQLYDSTMFVNSLDSIDREKFIIGTYYIEDTPGTDFIDHYDQLQRLIAEGGTGDWMRVAQETDEVREMLSGRLVGYYGIPAEPGTKKAVIQIAYPTAAWDRNPNFPMMMLQPMGNCFIFSTKFRLLDVAFPPTIGKWFPGPKYGIEGMRETLGIHDRPLVLHIIKPKMGMTPEETAEQVYQTALGGADLMKDDEMQGDAFNCSFEDRLAAVTDALQRAEKKTGKKAMYFCSVTDEVDRLVERSRQAVKNGASGLLLTYSAGYSALKAMAADPGVACPILLHVSHQVALLPAISFTVLAKMTRLAGADMTLVPTTWSSYQVASLEEGQRAVHSLQQKLFDIKRTWPVPGGGLHPGLVHHVMAEYGKDIVLACGGGMVGHPDGPKAGATALRQAVDAAVNDVPVEDAAQKNPELKRALEQWGSFERPTTPWGYASSEFRPKKIQRV